MNTIAFSYLGYYYIKYEQKIEATVMKVKQESLGKARGYFDDHPVIYKDFEKWAKGKIAFQIESRVAPYWISSLR